MLHPQPLVQKYKSAYYCSMHGAEVEHYVMFEGVRTRHSSMDEALQVCEEINRQRGLPNITVYRSSTFNTLKEDHVS